MSEKKEISQRQKVIKLTVAAVLTALSLVLMATLRFPVFTSFYELEFSDFPILVCTFLLGPLYGIVSLFIVCLIQTLTVSSFSGIIGFIMHFVASGAMILTVYFIKSKFASVKGTVISSVLGALIMTLIMIPMNIWLTSVFMQLPASEFIKGYLGFCVAFNLLKSVLNIVIFYASFSTVGKLYNKLYER